MKQSILGPFTALGAMAIALAAAVAGRPREVLAAPSSWTTTIESGADHITPRELADRLLADPGSVLLVDVRPAQEFTTFHLPSAVNLDLQELFGERGRTTLDENRGKLVVLCSNGMTHPGQAWVELAREGRDDVRVLEDGLDGFVRDVLTPPSLREDVTAETIAAEHARFERDRAAFLAVAPVQEPAAKFEPKPAQAPAEKPKVAELATDPPVLEQPTVVSAAWVAKRGTAVVVIDAREKPEDFAAGHLPGAIHVPIKALRGEREGVPDELLAPEKLAELFGSLGLDADTEVVAYGEAKLQDPAHLALALIRLGHRKVALLEGGLAAWKAAGLALSLEHAVLAPRKYAPRPSDVVRVAMLPDVERAMKDHTARILDVRPADAFQGEVSTEARAGHIPTSLNRPYTKDLVVTDAGPRWRPLDDLRREYESQGLHREDPVIVTCRTGHQAAQTWFTLHYLLGYENVSWYDGSWKEWAAHPELPAETGAGTR